MTHAPDSASAAERQDPAPLLELRIRLYRKGADWLAECLDLDLLTKRPTQREALQALINEIKLYLESAIEFGKFDLLVPRPAPASHWLNYYTASIVDEARRVLNGVGLGTTYSLPIDRRGHSFCA